MKVTKVALLFMSLFGLFSCKRCVKCTTTIVYQGNAPSSSIPEKATSETNCCGTTKDIENYEKENSSSTEVKLNNYILKEITKTICER